MPAGVSFVLAGGLAGVVRPWLEATWSAQVKLAPNVAEGEESTDE